MNQHSLPTASCNRWNMLQRLLRFMEENSQTRHKQNRRKEASNVATCTIQPGAEESNEICGQRPTLSSPKSGKDREANCVHGINVREVNDHDNQVKR